MPYGGNMYDHHLVQYARTRPKQEPTGTLHSGQLTTIGLLADLVTDINALVYSVISNGEGDWLTPANKMEALAERCRDQDRLQEELAMWKRNG